MLSKLIIQMIVLALTGLNILGCESEARTWLSKGVVSQKIYAVDRILLILGAPWQFSYLYRRFCGPFFVALQCRIMSAFIPEVNV